MFEFDPGAGRFLTVDPVLDTASPQQLNGYSYGNNNPTSTSDPMGTDPPPVGCKNTSCYNCIYNNTGCSSSKSAPPPPGCGSSASCDHASGGDRYVAPPGDSRSTSPGEPPPGYHSYCGYGACQNVRDGQRPVVPVANRIYATPYGVCGIDIVACDPNPADHPQQGSCDGIASFIACNVFIALLSCITGCIDGIALDTALDAGIDAAANAGDHIVLGLEAHGLEATAAKVGGRTLLKDPEWMTTLQEGIANPSTKFTVSLDGMSGSSTYTQVMSAAGRGAAGRGGYTDWEMAQLYQGGRLSDTTFIRGGSVIANPFG